MRAISIALAFAFGLAVAETAVAADSLERLHPDELINPFLGPEYARWMVGPVAQLASEDERVFYLLIESDEEASAFVEEFWSSRPAGLRREFELRAAEADKRYSESGLLGRRTDRGMVYVLFGDPEKTEWEQYRNIDDPNVELWTYPKKVEKGLHGKKPSRRYRFARSGDVMRLYSNDPADLENRRRRMLRRATEPRRPWRP